MHRWVGLLAAFYVVMAAATGALLMFKHELLGLAHPELGPPPPNLVARAERLAETLPRGSFTSIKFPDDALPAFIVYRPEHRTALYDPATLRPLDDRFGLNRAMDWTFELHHYLLAGETGKIVSGAFGVAIAILVPLGLFLWWPWRGGWRLAHARPRRATRSARLAGHTSLAVLMAPALFVAAVSGAAVIFHVPANAALAGLFGSRDPAVAPAGGATLAEAARRTFPAGEPRVLVPAGATGGSVTLRVRQPEERHPNGRSTLVFDPAAGRAVAATSEPRAGAGNRLYNLLYPLHTGAIAGLPLRLFYLLSAPLAFLAAFHGLRAILTPRRRRTA